MPYAERNFTITIAESRPAQRNTAYNTGKIGSRNTTNPTKNKSENPGENMKNLTEKKEIIKKNTQGSGRLGN